MHSRVHAKWNAPVGAVYIGRPSEWGNPVRLADPKDNAQRVRCLSTYIEIMRRDVRTQEAARERLAGQHLACFCAPRLCHGDVLARLADGMKLDEIEFELLVEPAHNQAYDAWVESGGLNRR